jgi:hypothetical protein
MTTWKTFFVSPLLQNFVKTSANAKLVAHADFASADFTVPVTATATAGDAGVAVGPDDFAVFARRAMVMSKDSPAWSWDSWWMDGYKVWIHGRWTQWACILIRGLFRRLSVDSQPLSECSGRRQIDCGFLDSRTARQLILNHPELARAVMTAGATRAFGHGATLLSLPNPTRGFACCYYNCRGRAADGNLPQATVDQAPTRRNSRCDQREPRDGDALSSSCSSTESWNAMGMRCASCDPRC